MLTARGWWFLVVVAFLILIGVSFPSTSVVPALLGLTLLGWFAVEWVLFHLGVNATVSRLRVSRRIVQGGRDVPMVWAGLSFEVRLTAHSDGPVGVPFVVLEDRLPVIAEKSDGENEIAAALDPGEATRIRYTLKAPVPGVLRFEGVRVRLADLHGFFYHRRFLREPTEFLVLPPLSDDEGHQRATKRFNTLPPPGLHRLRRPGSGGDLLELRDYRPGDPPKMIAWKPSARRDRLITKEFESDVPVRCVLFLDTSEGMRLGPPGGTPLIRMTAVASAVSQAAAGNRDLVGLYVFDTESAKGSNPARTKLHMINVMRQLAEVASLQPGTTGVTVDELTRRAYPLAHELYPELMAKKVNSMPLGRLWRPLLDRKYGWLVMLMILAGPVLAVAAFKIPIPDLLAEFFWWMRKVLNAAADLTPRRFPLLLKIPIFLLFFTLFIFPLSTLGLIYWLFHGISGYFGLKAYDLTRRKRLAALFAVQDGSGAAGTERLIQEDEAYAARVGRFFREHQLRCPVPLYDDQGRYRYRGEAKARVLADAVLRSVSRARDNELYVLLADLLDLGDELAPLLKAARVARARHHHVLVIVPWPGDVPPPEDEPEKGRRRRKAEPVSSTWTRPGPRPRPRAEPRREVLTVVQASLARQYHESYRKLRRALGKVGATVVRVNEGDPVQLVLDRLDRLRGMRSRR
jgi:uncharacterized protein (DUF58 family)